MRAEPESARPRDLDDPQPRSLTRYVRHRVSAYRRRHAIKEFSALRGIARRLGYHLVPANYHSPIPDLPDIPTEVWTEPDDMPGIAWNLDRQIVFLEEELGPLIREHGAPADPPGTETGFYLRNPFFGGLDAEVLYAMVRRLRPATVMELGAGYSTLVIADAAQRNRSCGSSMRHLVYDPFPSPVLAAVRDRIELHEVPASEIVVDRFAELEPGDILFIDTTHTLKPAGDVVHLILNALPRVAPGVVVQIHDFFRPLEYPRWLMDVFGCYWQEHYVVQALLSDNPGFEILCANHALRQLRSDRIHALLPNIDPHAEPSSLWIKRREFNGQSAR